jgi:hypothetical protein
MPRLSKILAYSYSLLVTIKEFSMLRAVNLLAVFTITGSVLLKGDLFTLVLRYIITLNSLSVLGSVITGRSSARYTMSFLRANLTGVVVRTGNTIKLGY